jgi:hypothetical protein
MLKKSEAVMVCAHQLFCFDVEFLFKKDLRSWVC